MITLLVGVVLGVVASIVVRLAVSKVKAEASTAVSAVKADVDKVL